MQGLATPKQPTELPPSEVVPDARLERRSRRVFSSEYKLKILSEADQCEHAELDPLLRRESLYSNQLQQWRREFAADGVAGLSKSAPGPKARLTAEHKDIERLKLQNQRLQKKLAVAEGCLELQKKLCRCSNT
jgi:transposase-like protein